VTNFVEPWVIGKRTGVSALALLVSALLWTWLWGPLGLVLATPLTVCAAVVGRHVSELSFLAILLGDDVGLNAGVNFYQRALAGATKEAQHLAKRSPTETSLDATCDELLVPALQLMVRDQRLEVIDQNDADRLVKDIGGVFARLGSAQERANAASSGPLILGLPAESEADVLLLRMLGGIVGGASPIVVATRDASRSKVLGEALRRRPSTVCIAALPPSGHVNARFFCRRLRAQLKDAYILVLVPEAPGSHSPEAAARLREAGASSVVSSLREAKQLLLENAVEPAQLAAQ
jgi:hypothetical protein